jgi:eukaryotic-like serine/threonine-protein kinase
MSEIAAGTIISGRFRVLAVLGKGAMGIVYLAEQLDHAGEPLREVALKTIRPDSGTDPELAAQLGTRFLREVRVAARLSSPNTVTVHDSGKTEDGVLYFSMELVRGDTLRELIRREGPLPAERALRIAMQVCDALAEAHSGKEPIVHRDLKPANMFVQTREGRDWVKVADFGIAKILGAETSGLTATGLSPGTPLYMSPEQWKGKENIDPRSDLYALGAVLHEMLSGTPPFVGEPHVLMYCHLNKPPPELPDVVPPRLRELVRMLLEKDPAARPESAAAVRRALEEAMIGVPPEEAAVTALLPSAKGPPANRAVRADPTAVVPEDSASRVPMAAAEPHAVATPPPATNPSGRPQPRSPLFPVVGAVVIAAATGALWMALTRGRHGGAGRAAHMAATEAVSPVPLLGARPPAPTEKTLAASPSPSEVPSKSHALAEGAAQGTKAESSAGPPLVAQRDRLPKNGELGAAHTMVTVPGGAFFMGCNPDVDSECFANEKPGRTVSVGEFRIDKYEVTVADYQRCVQAGTCSTAGLEMPYWEDANHPEAARFCNWAKTSRENHPINCLNWNQAHTYCQWAGKRLPVEEEWEKAARGTSGQKYPWGNAGYGTSRRVANIADETAKRSQPRLQIAEGYDDGFAETAPVGSFPAGASPYGALDMVGNVAEWVETQLDQRRGVRGGSWSSDSSIARASKRNWIAPETRRTFIGLRCAQ